MEKAEPFTTDIKCTKCKQEGWIVWEKIPGRAKRAIISMSNGFYRRIGNNGSVLLKIVCDSCGARMRGIVLNDPVATETGRAP